MPSMLDPSLCPSCFRPAEPPAPCRHCGYDRSKPANVNILAPLTELAGRYVIGGLLGQGGFGATYRGYDTRLASVVAIKEFFPFGTVSRSNDGIAVLVSGPSQDSFEFGRAKFVEEARTLAKLRAIQRVVSVFDFFEENNTAYIIMEFAAGVTLKTLQARQPNNRLPLQMGLPVLIDVLGGLADIHKHQILHRDISPDNILIDRTGAIKLLDFGAARQSLVAKDQRMTVILKPGYAPFEQYSEVSSHGPWTDIYAASATFYTMLSGKKPVDSLSRLTGDTLQPLSGLGLTLPPRLDRAIMKGLAIQPKDRWQAAAEFAEELRAAGIAAPAPSPPPRRDEPVRAPVEGDIRRHAEADTRTRTILAPAEQVLLQPARPQRTSGGPSSDDDFGMPMSPVELQKCLQEHAKFLAGKIHGRRLNLSMRSLSGLKLTQANLAQAELSAVDFSQCDLARANFTMANLFCANFTGANLVSAKFDRCDLRGARFDGAELTRASFIDADCREGVMMLRGKNGQLLDVKNEMDRRAASFANAKMSDAVLRNANLGGARFERAALESADFHGADLRGANMVGALLNNAKFENSNLLDCNFNEACLDGVDISAMEVRGAKMVRQLNDIEESLKQKIVEHQKWVDSLSHRGTRMVLKTGDLSGLQMANADWSAAELLSITMNDINLHKAKVSMTDFSGSHLNGACLVAADARGAKFNACHVRNADFTGANLSPVIMASGQKLCAAFRKCDLRGSTFETADCQGANFRDADLTDVNFHQAVLKNANFTGAVITGANFDGAALDGAIGLAIPDPA